MGICDLLKFIQGSAVKQNLEGRRVAVDLQTFLYKAKRTNRALTQFLTDFHFQLKSCGNTPIYVFEGESPEEKMVTREERRKALENTIQNHNDTLMIVDFMERINIVDLNGVNFADYKEKFGDQVFKFEKSFDEVVRIIERRMKSHGCLLKETNYYVLRDEVCPKYERYSKKILSSDVDEAHSTFESLNALWVQAPTEGERTCVIMLHGGMVDAVLSEDSDVLAFGGNLNAKYTVKSGKIITDFFDVNKVRNDLGFESQEQFLDFCIMCGCDFNKHIPGKAIKTVYPAIKTHKTIEKVLEANPKWGDGACLNYINARRMFELPIGEHITIHGGENDEEKDVLQCSALFGPEGPESAEENENVEFEYYAGCERMDTEFDDDDN